MTVAVAKIQHCTSYQACQGRHYDLRQGTGLERGAEGLEHTIGLGSLLCTPCFLRDAILGSHYLTLSVPTLPYLVHFSASGQVSTAGKAS